MSLINDALKQASRAPKHAVATASASHHTAAGLRPVDAPRQAGSGKSAVLSILLAVVLGAAGWFLWQWWQAGQSGSGFNVNNLVQSVRESLPGAKPALASASAGSTAAGPVSRPPAGAAAPTETASGARAVTSAATPAPAADDSKPQGSFLSRVFNRGSESSAAKPGTFPPIKVQGIYYRVGDSTVLINGKNLTEGDEIDGVKVAKIDRQTVTLEYQGLTKEWKLH